jgi:TonB family protein
MKTNLWLLALAYVSLSNIVSAQSPSPTKKTVGATTQGTQVQANQPTLIKSVPPTYPQEAKEQGIQGSVRLHVLVGTDGVVKEASVLSGPPSLTQAAVDAVRQWRYKPYLLNGNPVEVDTTVIVNFNFTVEEPLSWWVVVTEVAKATPSSKINAELKGRPVVFPYGIPLDSLHEKLFRSLGASDEVIEAARHAQVYPTLQPTDAEKKLLATSESDVRDLIAKSPEKAELHELLAMILLRERANHDAIMELRKVLLLAPDSPSAHLYLGLALIRDGTPQTAEEAISNFRESLRLLPDQFEGHISLGTGLMVRNDWDGAIAEFQKTLDLPLSAMNRSQVHEDMGDAYGYLKKYALALSEYHEALRYEPAWANSPYTHDRLGTAQYGLGDYRNAVIEFRKYVWLQRDPSDTIGRNKLAASLYQLGQYSESMSQAKAAVAADPNDKTAKAWLDQATAKVQSGAEGPQTVVVQVNTGGGGGGGLAGTTWACHDFVPSSGSTSSLSWGFGSDGTLQAGNADGTGLGATDQTWEQDGTELVLRGPGAEGIIFTGTISGDSLDGVYSDNNERVTCTRQSGPVQSNSVSAVNVGPPASYFTSPTIQSSGSGSNTTGSGSGSSSAAANSVDSDSVSAKRQNDPGGSQADGNDYTDTASQCGHPQIEANTLYIVNECGFQVDATYTSQGDIWGETPLGPGEHHRTAYSAAAVNNVGGVNVYTCPGSGTAVDPAGNPIGLAPRYTAREYRCHR